MNAAAWGERVGRWHDLGKYSLAFQAYLERENGFEAHLEQYKGRVDHSTAGARHAAEAVPDWGQLPAYAIAGHHAGLPDAGGGPSSLEHRLDSKLIEPVDAAPEHILAPGEPLTLPSLSIDPADRRRASFQLAFFTRMLFSCLVDADYLATEAFMDPARASSRPAGDVTLESMRQALDVYLGQLAEGAEPSAVSERRAEVLQACRAAAEREPGLFSLTVPTGGGKTLASLAFTLQHAARHSLRRVIYGIPFTSIIEQTADQFRRVFNALGEDVVLEHHSNVDPDSDHETVRSRLAAENWDAPLVVTTNVQLFESLFAARTSCCRKLHNIAGSVITLDEAQTLPVELLKPCLAVLRELAATPHEDAPQHAVRHHAGRLPGQAGRRRRRSREEEDEASRPAAQPGGHCLLRPRQHEPAAHAGLCRARRLRLLPERTGAVPCRGRRLHSRQCAAATSTVPGGRRGGDLGERGPCHHPGESGELSHGDATRSAGCN